METEESGKCKTHPTCNLVPLRTGTKIIALVDMLCGLFGIIWFVYMLERYGLISLDPFEKIDADKRPAESIKSDNSSSHAIALANSHKVISLTLSSFYTAVNLSIFIILLIGAHQKSIAKCLVWFYIRCAILVFKIIIYLMYILSGRPLYSQIPFMIFMLIHIFGLWVVNSYVEELREERRQKRLQEIMMNIKDSQDDDTNGIENEIRIRKMGLENAGFAAKQ